MKRKERFLALRIDRQILDAGLRNELQSRKYRYVTVRLAGMFRVEIGNGHIWPSARTEIFYWHPLSRFVLRTKSEVLGGRMQMIRVRKKTVSSFAEFLQFAASTYVNGLDTLSRDDFIVNLNILDKKAERELDGKIEDYYRFEVEDFPEPQSGAVGAVEEEDALPF